MSASFRQDLPYQGRRLSDDRYRNDSYGRDRDGRSWDPRFRDRVEDRDRERLPDSSPRDRERERGREWSSVDGSVNHARQENSATTPSIMGSTGGSPYRDRKNPAHEISAFFRKYGDILAERSSLKSQEDALDKLMKQKKAEYDKSLPKHAEYPSVPELHKKWRDCNDRDRANLDRLLKANDEAYKHASDAIANSLLQGLPMAEMQSRIPHGPPPKVDSREVDSKIATLKSQLQNQINQNQHNFKIGLAKQEELLQTELTQQEERFKKELENQSLIFQKEMEKQRGDFRKELERQRNEFSKEMAKQQGGPKGPRTQGAPDKLDALQKENAALRSRLDDLSRKFEESQRDVTGLHDQLRAQGETLRDTTTTMKDHSTKLNYFDVELQREALENFCFTLPTVIETQAKHRKEIDGLMDSQDQFDRLNEASAQFRKEIDDLRDSGGQLDGLKEAQDQVILRIGGMINNLREMDEGKESRIAKLEKMADERPVAGPDMVPKGGMMEKLERDLASLTDRLDTSVRSVIEDLEKKCDGLSLQVSTLDSQYNNLTTKTLAEHVIGHLENIYPNAKQLGADIEILYDKSKKVDEKLKTMQAILDRAIQLAETATRNWQDGPDAGLEHHGQFVKKRKLESGNGVDQAAHAMNGHR